MGIKANKSYTAREIKKALEALEFTNVTCRTTKSNFLVTATSQFRRASTASCGLDGEKCKAGGLTGSHGLRDLGKRDLAAQ